MKVERNHTCQCRAWCAALLAGSVLVIFISCGGGSGLFSGLAQISGLVTRPTTGFFGSTPVALPNSPISIIALGDAGINAIEQQIGTTAADGSYAVQVAAQSVAAIVIRGTTSQGAIRIQGLVRPDTENLTADFDPVTDVAAEAALSALRDGSLAVDQLDSSRIANFEQGAQNVLQTTSVNFFDARAVSAAASTVRSVTNNGAVASGGSGSGLSCQNGTFTCGNGSQICAEYVCNGSSDCSDGSDETSSTCGEDVSCCIATNGCPSETSSSCGETCCCCPFGQICDQSNPANGCVSISSARTMPDDENPLSKLLIEGIYY